MNPKDEVLSQIEEELNQRLLPHIRGEAKHGYPFNDAAGLSKSTIHRGLDVDLQLMQLRREVKGMGKELGEAFLYLACCDLKARLKLFQQFAEQHTSTGKVAR